MVYIRFWEKNAGLEDIQAKIWNFNNPDSNEPATAQQILERYEKEKIDPKTVRYAFSDKGKPLAYIQARDYDKIKETHVGFPWAFDGCPLEVQEKLFEEIIDYIKQREDKRGNTHTIRMNADARNEKIIKFFRSKGLKEISNTYRYDLDLKTLSETDNNTEYTIKKGTKEDLNNLVNLIKNDGRYEGQLSSDESIKKYLMERVLPADHVVLVFDKSTLVQATAPLLLKLPGEDDEQLILRFHSIQPGVEDAWKPLLIGVGRECFDTNYGTDKTLSIYHGPQDSPEQVRITESFNPKKEINSYVFGI